MMTRKDYVETARIIADFRQRNNDALPALAFMRMVQAFADMMEADNSRFDRERFITACLLDNEHV